MDQITFNDIMNLATVNMTSAGSVTWVVILINLTVSFIIGTSIALIYRKAFVGILFQKSFAVSLVLICLVTTMIIMVISGNLILSLGMVGALSIVRFRAAIKEPIDIVYMFWAVGVGIANGVSIFSISIISSIFIAFVMLYLAKFESRPKSKLLVIKGPSTLGNSVCETITRIFHKNSTQKSYSKDADSFEAVYELRGREDIFQSSEMISKEHPEVELRFLSYPAN